MQKFPTLCHREEPKATKQSQGLPRPDKSGLAMTRKDVRETVESTNKIVVLITTSSEEEAHKIAESLVNGKKAACVNIVPRVDSLFWWKDKLDSARESLLLVKTKASLFPEIISLVKEIHSYEVPEIIALPIIAGSEDYLKWLDIACR
jgi:periplasmic divalent cation tolerance protein